VYLTSQLKYFVNLVFKHTDYDIFFGNLISEEELDQLDSKWM